MDIGKVSQAVYDRSVYRPLKKSGCLDGQLRYGTDACLAQGGRYLEAVSCGPVGGHCDADVRMRIAEAVNNLAAEGADCDQCRIKTGIVFPAGSDDYPEEKLRALEEEIGSCCSGWGLVINGGHTECSDAVFRPVLSLTAEAPLKYSTAQSGPNLSLTAEAPPKYSTAQSGPNLNLTAETSAKDLSAGLKPGLSLDLVMAGYAGQAGSALIARNFRRELKERLPSFLIDDAAALDKNLLIRDIAELFWEAGAVAMKDISRSGVFAALWEFSEKLRCGFFADLKKIPIRQESIEICEYFDLNPYQLYGQGALLAVLPGGSCQERPQDREGEGENARDKRSDGTMPGTDALLHALAEKGIPACRIGTVTAGRARIIGNGEISRFLERPGQDALHILAERGRKDI